MPLLGFPRVLCVQGKLPGNGNTALDPLRLGVLTEKRIKTKHVSAWLACTLSQYRQSIFKSANSITHQLGKVDRMLIENGVNYKMLVEELVLRCLGHCYHKLQNLKIAHYCLWKIKSKILIGSYETLITSLTSLFCNYFFLLRNGHAK